jgi:hypothetical protein
MLLIGKKILIVTTNSQLDLIPQLVKNIPSRCRTRLLHIIFKGMEIEKNNNNNSTNSEEVITISSVAQSSSSSSSSEQSIVVTTKGSSAVTLKTLKENLCKLHSNLPKDFQIQVKPIL